MVGLFDRFFATPGGGILPFFNDPSGALPPDSPQQWGAPGGYGLASSSPDVGAQNSGGYPAMTALVGFNPGFAGYAASANPQTGAHSQVTPPAAADAPSGDLSGGKAVPDNVAGGDFLSRLGQALHDNSSMLMAMGGGMMTGGLGKGFQAGAAAADEATSKRQAPQTVKVRQPGGGEMLMMWDPGQRRFVPAPTATGGMPAPVASTGGYSEGTTATNPQSGQRIIFRNGQWQPM